MSQKRYGPVLGPGVAVIEKDAGKSIQAAPFGVTGFVGVLEKGMVGELISCYSLRDYRRQCGGRISTSLVPDAVEDFWNHGNGAGELHLLRVTDGNEVAAFVKLQDRVAPANESAPTTKSQAVMKISAKNGGRWGGKTRVIAGELADYATGIPSTTTIATGVTMLENEWAGGYLYLEDDATATPVPIVSNTTAGVITASSNYNLQTLVGGALTDLGYTLTVERDTAKELSVIIGDGEVDPATLFSLTVLVDGAVVLYYPNLSIDPASTYYFESAINDDPNNFEVVVDDLNTSGNYAATLRPASYYGKSIADTGLVGAVLQATPFQFSRFSGTGTYSAAIGTVTDAMKYPAIMTLTLGAGSPATTATGTISFLGKDDATPKTLSVAAFSITGAFQPCAFLPPITVTGTKVAGDVWTFEWNPFEPDALIGGYVYPDVTSATYGKDRYRIIDNDCDSLTVSQVFSLGGATGAKEFRVEAPVKLSNGYDGVAPVDADYTAVHFDAELSEFNDLLSMNKGLVRLACPGVHSTAVVKAGVAFAEAKNWQYRIDLDHAITTENAAILAVNTTLGRNDFAVTAFPSFGWVSDPDRPGQLKLISLTGAIMGREAAVARNYGGYHKAPAGIDFTLSRVIKLDTSRLNEELLNPQGINVVKFVKGNCIVWGARTLSTDSSWKFIHHRAMMSHYEHILQENFDWTIFQINDAMIQGQIVSALRSYFIPEWRNHALRGAKFEDACSIKVDNEINTDLTRAAGDLYAEINLQLADTVERFIMIVSKDGVFEQTA